MTLPRGAMGLSAVFVIVIFSDHTHYLTYMPIHEISVLIKVVSSVGQSAHMRRLTLDEVHIRHMSINERANVGLPHVMNFQ